jgi:hypothetical protein
MGCRCLDDVEPVESAAVFEAEKTLHSHFWRIDIGINCKTSYVFFFVFFLLSRA